MLQQLINAKETKTGLFEGVCEWTR